MTLLVETDSIFDKLNFLTASKLGFGAGFLSSFETDLALFLRFNIFNHFPELKRKLILNSYNLNQEYSNIPLELLRTDCLVNPFLSNVLTSVSLHLESNPEPSLAAVANFVLETI